MHGLTKNIGVETINNGYIVTLQEYASGNDAETYTPPKLSRVYVATEAEIGDVVAGFFA